MAEPVMVLAPDMRGQQVVQRGDRPPPRDVAAGLQPFGVLVHHRVDDVDERLVAGKQAVPPGQQIAFQPALAGVLAQDLHDAAVRREVPAIGVLGQDALPPRCAATLPAPRRAGSTRSRPGRKCGNSAVSALASITSRRRAPIMPRRLAVHRARRGHLQRVRRGRRQAQRAAQQAAIGVRVGAHALDALRARGRGSPRTGAPVSSNSSSGR